MYHYIVKVPSGGENLAAPETIIDRLDYFNDRSNYLLYDGGNEVERRFIMVTDKMMSKNIATELKDIFEIPVSTEAISVKTANRKILKKIHTAKALMVHNDFHGEQKTLLVTDTVEQLFQKVNSMIGFAKFKDFFKGFSDYIDQTSEMRAKSLFNVVLINKCGMCLDKHIELLYSLLFIKGLLTEHVMISGDKWDAKNTSKETKFLYYIEDDWNLDDGGQFIRASDEVKLLDKIRRSENIYITAMSQEQYDKLSTLDFFRAAFPNTVTIDELTQEEKIEYICSITAEYGYTLDQEGFIGSRFIERTSVENIEMVTRGAIVKKLKAKDKTFCLDLSDIDTRAKKIKKVSAFVELESLIGLTGVKDTVKEIVTFLKRRGKSSMPCLHMCFRGNPGTAKTSVARILSRIFYEAGIIKKNLLVETDRGGLVGQYVGHTAEKTARKIESALGGVLFIDEAYSLFSESGIDYGHECVNTLVKNMEDKRDEFICILAGYSKEMNDMLNMNPGLRDRIQFYIDFPDYNESELTQIFGKLCRDNKYRLTPSAKDTLSTSFSRLVRAKSKNFSNGRLIRKLFERVKIKQALRTSNNIITDADIELVLAEKDIATLFIGDGRAQIGFNV